MTTLLYRFLLYNYSVLFYCITPFLLLERGYKILRQHDAISQKDEIKRLGERIGWYTPGTLPPLKNSIWIHAASVGETRAIRPLVQLLRQHRPQCRIIITSVTRTGNTTAHTLFGDHAHTLYVPYDLPGPTRRLLTRIRPQLLIILETELWPNLLYLAHTHNIPVLLANARLSQRSFKRYQYITYIVRTMMQHITTLIAQSEADAQRFLTLGISPKKVHVTANLKCYMPSTTHTETQSRLLYQHIMTQNTPQARPIIVAGSTHDGEEQYLLEAFSIIKRNYPYALLVLAPRHPRRFDTVWKLLTRALPLHAQRYTDGALDYAQIDLLLLDTIGVLPVWYGLATLAVVGGSLVDGIGGHNVLEPASLGVATVIGPYCFQCQSTIDTLCQAQALIQLTQSYTLTDTLIDLLQQPQKRETIGLNAKQFIEEQQSHLRIYRTHLLKHTLP